MILKTEGNNTKPDFGQLLRSCVVSLICYWLVFFLTDPVRSFSCTVLFLSSNTYQSAMPCVFRGKSKICFVDIPCIHF